MDIRTFHAMARGNADEAYDQREDTANYPTHAHIYVAYRQNVADTAIEWGAMPDTAFHRAALRAFDDRAADLGLIPGRPAATPERAEIRNAIERCRTRGFHGGEVARKAHKAWSGGDDCTFLRDLLADLMHWADSHAGLECQDTGDEFETFDEALEVARKHFEDESAMGDLA